jgi:osmotically-inducible protein OsmY
MNESEHPDYVSQRVWDALARDPRTNEMEVRVRVAGMKVFITGTVASEERRANIETVVMEIAPDYEIQNQITVGDFPAASASEPVS